MDSIKNIKNAKILLDRIGFSPKKEKKKWNGIEIVLGYERRNVCW